MEQVLQPSLVASSLAKYRLLRSCQYLRFVKQLRRQARSLVPYQSPIMGAHCHLTTCCRRSNTPRASLIQFQPVRELTKKTCSSEDLTFHLTESSFWTVSGA